jgi:hypothetical protein
MTDRTWRNNTGHLKANILGGPGANALRQTPNVPNLPIAAREINGARYEVHSVEGRLEITQQVISEIKNYIGRVEHSGDEYLALYDRSVRNLFPLTNSFAFSDTGLSEAIGWIVEQAEKEEADRLERGWQKLKAKILAELKALDNEN